MRPRAAPGSAATRGKVTRAIKRNTMRPTSRLGQFHKQRTHFLRLGIHIDHLNIGIVDQVLRVRVDLLDAELIRHRLRAFRHDIADRHQSHALIQVELVEARFPDVLSRRPRRTAERGTQGSAGVFAWLAFWRLAPRRWQNKLALPLGLVLLAPLATALIEGAWYGLATGVRASRVLAANLDIEAGRPSAWIFVSAIALLLVATGRRLWQRRARVAMARAT